MQGQLAKKNERDVLEGSLRRTPDGKRTKADIFVLEPTKNKSTQEV